MSKSKVGGGLNSMHLSDTAHPFTKGPFKGSSKSAKSQATGATAASRPGFRSANAAMKSKKT